MEKTIQKTVEDFKNYVDRINMFRQAMSIMDFDAETIAPDGGLEMRAKREGFFWLEVYNMITSSEMKAFFDELKPFLPELDDATRAMYRVTKDYHDSYLKIPGELVKKFAELAAESTDVWRKARKDNDFAKFAPYLERIIKMSQEKLAYRVDEVPEGGTLYDVLLDDYEKGMTVKKYDEFFDELKKTVVPLVRKVMASTKKIDKSFVNAKVDIDTQRKISKFMAKEIGYDLNRGYIAESAHPFCSGPDSSDVRITTRYNETDFLSSFFSILHECGHAIYEQGIGEDIAGTLIGGGTSSGLHESQSRFYENVIGRSREFWQFIAEKLKAYLPEEFANATPEMFFEAANESKPSLIRVEADELTYSLHIIVRYEIEKMLFGGECEISELPSIWNAKYQEYLGITSPDDADGIMQDIHWSGGMFGYFPTYALGSAYAAQYLHNMQEEMNVSELIKSGNFAEITGWLRDKIHVHGMKYTPVELMEKSFGEQLNAKHYAEYLQNKYSALYELHEVE